MTVPATEGSTLVTFTLFGVAGTRVPSAMLRMAADRRQLAHTSGLSFFKLLGTGDGASFTLRHADLRRWALLAVWDTSADLLRFERSSPTAAAWRRLAEERWRADLSCVRTRGRWAGQEPFVADDGAGSTARDRPVAAITRARLRPRRARSFWTAVPPVARAAASAPGLLFSAGIGEAPIGLQGTFSLWRSAEALTEFAYRRTAHRQAIARTEPAGWYREELFARFAVLQTTGTVGGRDPLRG